MLFPRYEFVIPRDHERCPGARRPQPRPASRPRPVRPVRPVRRPRSHPPATSESPALAIHEYLELEFTVEDRR